MYTSIQKKGDSKAVDGNHFTMYENETLAIVGESGCGKSVTAMSILGLVSEPGEIMPGSKIVYMEMWTVMKMV